ncbi:hypothetical protein DF035_36755 [Burkholderia contaminans]|nr:hypothetical protein DF035_36755 [Burkholderia contaminans]
MLTAALLQLHFQPNAMRAFSDGLFLPVITVLDVFFQPMFHIDDGGSQVGDRAIPFANGFFQLLLMHTLHLSG